MTEENLTQSPHAGKGKAFFERAQQVAETGNWDFAIEMYLQGIQREPDNVQEGHQPLREVSLKRKAQGGKNAGMMEQMRHRSAKDPTVSLINAEFLLAKEPGSGQYMEQVLKAAQALKIPELVGWISNIMAERQKLATKKDRRVLLMLMKAFQEIERYGPALQVGEMAHEMTPDDDDLNNALRGLGARLTLQKGKYGEKGDFSKGVKDMGKQKELAKGDLLQQDRAFLEEQIEKARAEYLASPNVVGKINGLVDALLKTEDESYENEAIDVLTKAHRDSGAYQFKMRIGDVRMRQLTRRAKKLIETGDKAAAREHLIKQLQFELEEYSERAVNYPTDLAVKFELGLRQIKAGKYDEAIASLQQAQRDPRRHLRSLNLMGQAFATKKWYREAAETYERALNIEMTEDRAKEVRYNFGDVLEKMGDLPKAYDQFSQVAQVDFNYKDVRQRLDNIRKHTGGGGSSEKK